MVHPTLLDAGIRNAEDDNGQTKAAFLAFPNWRTSEAAYASWTSK
jgi:hypothetical protein